MDFVKAQEIGDSIRVTILKPTAKVLGIKKGTYLKQKLKGKKIILEKVEE